MIIEKFAALPPWIEFEGVNFELQLIVNGNPFDVRLVYALSSVDVFSRHYQHYDLYGSWENPFAEGRLQGFLFLVENIKNDRDVLDAIGICVDFLKQNKLWNQ